MPATDEGDQLAVTVTDTGRGRRRGPGAHLRVVPARRPRRAQGGGHRLGLTLCRRIVELFGGRMWLESEVGRRQHVRLRDPAAPRSPSRDATRRSSANCRVSSRRRRPRVARSVLGLPRGTGIDVVRRATGRTALALRPEAHARRQSCSTSGCQGWTAGRCCARSRPTRHGRHPGDRAVDRRRARARHWRWAHSDYLLKPVARDELLGALRAGRCSGRSGPELRASEAS